MTSMAVTGLPLGMLGVGHIIMDRPPGVSLSENIASFTSQDLTKHPYMDVPSTDSAAKILFPSMEMTIRK